MLFHIADEKAWQEALNRGQYRPPNFAAEGFVHLSTKAQLPLTAQRHCAGAAELLVLGVVPSRLKAPFLHWVDVPTRPDGPLPHYHASLPLGAVEDIFTLARTANGSFDFSRLPGRA